MNYVASCSFGKDSLAAIVAVEWAGVHIDEAVYCRIMFDRETSAELTCLRGGTCDLCY